MYYYWLISWLIDSLLTSYPLPWHVSHCIIPVAWQLWHSYKHTQLKITLPSVGVTLTRWRCQNATHQNPGLWLADSHLVNSWAPQFNFCSKSDLEANLTAGNHDNRTDATYHMLAANSVRTTIFPTKSSIVKNPSHLFKDSMEALHGVLETPQRKLVPSRWSSSTSETISRTS